MREIAIHELSHLCAMASAIYIRHRGHYANALVAISVKPDEGECVVRCPSLSMDINKQLTGSLALAPSWWDMEPSLRDHQLSINGNPRADDLQLIKGVALHLWNSMPVAKLANLLVDPRWALIDDDIPLPTFIPKTKVEAAHKAAMDTMNRRKADPTKAPMYYEPS